MTRYRMQVGPVQSRRMRMRCVTGSVMDWSQASMYW